MLHEKQKRVMRCDVYSNPFVVGIFTLGRNELEPKEFAPKAPIMLLTEFIFSISFPLERLSSIEYGTRVIVTLIISVNQYFNAQYN